MTMTKADLVQLVINEINCSAVDANKFINNFFNSMIECLLEEQSLTIPNFGNFILKKKTSRLGRNPKTKEPVIIPARMVVAFKASNFLKKNLNEPEQTPNTSEDEIEL